MLQGQKKDDEFIWFLYDEKGVAYGFKLFSSPVFSTFYYEFNLQGDIIGILDAAGTKVVGYTYDEWGEFLSITGTLLDTIGQKNPLRYRGYYYDAETGFYYLNSRYYDAVVGRFLNVDGIIGANKDVISCNLFTYCSNNPVNNYDPNGNFKISSLYNLVKKVLKVSVMMLEHALFGNGKAQSYSPESTVSDTLSKSKIMKNEIDDNIEKFKDSTKTSETYNGTVSLYGKNNIYDFDLAYSVGKASYDMTIKKETKETGFWVFKKTVSRYVVDVKVYDVYNFDEYRYDMSLGSLLNNVGYDMQQSGVFKEFSWDATYTVHTKWR